MNALAPISYEQSLKARYAVSRARLWTGQPPKARQIAVLPTPTAPEPEPEPAPKVRPPKVPRDERAPLNMLQPCSWRFLVMLASVRHNIPVPYILGKSRQRKIARARHEAIGLVYQHTQMSMPQVGGKFGRDHTTVLNSLRQVNATEKLVKLRPSVAAKTRSKLFTGMFCNGKGWISEVAA